MTSASTGSMAVPGLLSPPPVSAVFSLVTGPAGTGKTFLAHQWAAAASEAMLVATTGVAAINLGGTTINAALWYGTTEHLEDLYQRGRLQATLVRLRAAGVRWYVLDELSMLPARQLTCLVRAILEVNQRVNHYSPIRLTCVGDFGQLPPVPDPRYRVVDPLFAFESPEWARFLPGHLVLTSRWRHTDLAFIQALQAIRLGETEHALDFFGSQLQSTALTTYEGTTIKAKNDEVDRYNALCMDRLSGPLVTFPSRVTGEPQREWRLVPAILKLKIGALVMMLANKRIPGTTQFAYVNGDLGTLIAQEGSTAIVQLDRTKELVVVTPTSRDHQRVGSTGALEIVGRLTYMPLRAAWATTVHKSQGLTFDRIQVDFRNRFFTQPGMLYVALSRVRSATGLRLVGTARHFRERCTVNPKVRAWL